MVYFILFCFGVLHLGFFPLWFLLLLLFWGDLFCLGFFCCCCGLCLDLSVLFLDVCCLFVCCCFLFLLPAFRVCSLCFFFFSEFFFCSGGPGPLPAHTCPHSRRAAPLRAPALRTGPWRRPAGRVQRRAARGCPGPRGGAERNPERSRAGRGAGGAAGAGGGGAAQVRSVSALSRRGVREGGTAAPSPGVARGRAGSEAGPEGRWVCGGRRDGRRAVLSPLRSAWGTHGGFVRSLEQSFRCLCSLTACTPVSGARGVWPLLASWDRGAALGVPGAPRAGAPLVGESYLKCC